VKILAIDQARRGAWAVFDSQTKALERYGDWEFPNGRYVFPQAICAITRLIGGLIDEHGIEAVYIEDVSLGPNPQAFKRLAQLQGALLNLFEQLGVTYGVVPPTQWQSFCGVLQKNRTKELSRAFVKEQFGIDTENHNLTDAIGIGHYVAHQINEGDTPCKNL